MAQANVDQNFNTTLLGTSDVDNETPVNIGANPTSKRLKVDSLITQPLDLFGNLSTVQRATVIELKSTYGLSNLRDVTTVTGSGSVANTVGNGEYTVATGTTTGSTATIDSAERGRYVPGTEAEAGLGIRFPSQTFIGTAFSEWGYFDNDNGFGFGLDATGVYVFTKRGGTKTKVYQSNWNVDSFDGSGDSGLTLDLQDGNIFQIDYAWYGFGTLNFAIVTSDSNNKQVKYIVHRFNPENETSVKDPNLPLRAQVDNGDTTTNYQIFVAGRQYSVFTPYRPNNRINSQYVLEKGSVGTTFLPVISFRKKTAYKSVAVKLEGIDLVTDAALLYQIRLGATLTGGSYATPTDTTATETACEVNTTATAISGGDLLYQGILSSSGVGSNAAGDKSADILKVVIPEEQIVSLAVRRISGTGATVSAVLRWREEW